MTDRQKLIETVEAFLARLKAEPEPRAEWPLDGDTYYAIHPDGSIGEDVFCSTARIDNNRKAYGSCYRTEEEAERIVQNRETLTRLRKLANGFVPDWSDGTQFKFGVGWDSEVDKICKDFVRFRRLSSTEVYYRTEEERDAAIEAVGLERIKQLFAYGVL